MRKIYAIGVGGSGAKCIEAVVLLHSLGVYSHGADECQLEVLLVDADNDNGNVSRTGKVIEATIEAHKELKDGTTSLLKDEIVNYGKWNPLGDVGNNPDLETVFSAQPFDRQLRKLFGALYSPEEQKADLKVGFRGRPPIGSAVMSRVQLTAQQGGGNVSPWTAILDDIKRAADEKTDIVIHFFGSIFGGTGASGVPTLVKLIDTHLSDKRGRIRLNASLLLPYFSFRAPEDTDISADTRFFALNTQAALQYLAEQGGQAFDRIYLVGDQDRTKYEKSYTGGKKQRNKAHFVELYAALAIKNGFERFGQQRESPKGLYINRAFDNHLEWTDLPNNQEIRKHLRQGVRFAYAWLYNFSMELDNAITREKDSHFAKGAPWFRHYFSLIDGKDEKPVIKDEKQISILLTKWSWHFLRWAWQISNSHQGGAQFFAFSNIEQEFIDSDSNEREELDLNIIRSYRERLHTLVTGQSGQPTNAKSQKLDRLDTVKNELADQGKTENFGVKGLAHALFDLLQKEY